MRGKNRSRRYFIGVFVFLCCVTTEVHANNPDTIRKATVFIDTNISNGTGFYVGSNLIATSLHIISGADPKKIRVLSDGNNLGFYAVAAYDVRQNLALLRVTEPGTPLDLSSSDDLSPDQTIFISVHLPDGSKHLEERRTRRNTAKDLCQAGVKFDTIVGLNSDGGPALDFHGKVIGVFFIGLLEYKYEFRDLYGSFVVPVKPLRDLIKDAKGSVSVGVTVFKAELDYCALISRANARARKAKWFNIVGKLRNEAINDLMRGLKRFANKRNITLKNLRKIAKSLLF